MTFEEFEKADKRELRTSARMCFQISQDSRYEATMQVAKIIEAQFYMQEINRRHDSKIAWRDLTLEVIVIILIGVEIILAIKQGRDQGTVMDKQQAVLRQLDANMAKTAQTLKASLATMQAMNEGIRLQLGRMSPPEITVQVEMIPQRKLTILNSGNVDVELWGTKLGSHDPAFVKQPTHVRRGDAGAIETDRLLREADKALQEHNTPIPLTLYLRDDIGTEFVAEAQIMRVQTSTGPSIGSIETHVRQKHWSNLTLSK